MTTITTRLIKDGNSKAIRLSKPVLAMSGLGDTVELDVKKGQIVMRTSTDRKARTGWKEQIEQDIKSHGPLITVDEYGDLAKEAEATISDGLDGL